MKSQCSEDIICDWCSRFTTAAQKCSTVLPRSCHHWGLVKSGILDGLQLARHLELKLVHVILKWLLEIYANLGAMLQHDMNRSTIYLYLAPVLRLVSWADIFKLQRFMMQSVLLSFNFQSKIIQVRDLFFLNFSSPIKVIIAILLNSSDYMIHSARSYEWKH